MEGGRGEGAGGPAAADLRRDMEAARAVCERRIAQGRARTAAAASAFRGAILSARSLAEQSVAHRAAAEQAPSPPPPPARPASPATLVSEAMEGGRGEGAGGPAAADLRRDMAAARAGCERRIAQGRDRTAAAASAFRGAILSARSLASGSVAHREKLNALKDQLRGLEAGLAEALSTQLKKESECKLTSESISNAIATNEQLRGLVLDQRARRDEFANVISHQLEAIEALEANIDVVGKKNLDEAIMWYNKFLGFRVVAGEGVKFVFSKVDMQDDEYLFCIKVNKDEYSLIQCTPLLKDTEELVKDLNCTNDLFKFVRIMRARFQAAAIKGVHPATSLCTDTSSTPISSPPAVSVDTTSKGTTNQSHSRSRSKNQDPRAKRGAPPRSIASPLTSGSGTRRSPRFAAADAGNRH